LRLPPSETRHGKRSSRAVTACRDRLVGQGIDLAAYDLAAGAATMEDLRSTLGSRHVDHQHERQRNRWGFEVVGGSGRVRAMVVGLASLPSPDFPDDRSRDARPAISRLVTTMRCPADIARSFPDLDAMIRNASHDSTRSRWRWM